MQVDLYQRSGMRGLGDDAADLPVSDQQLPAYLQTPGSGFAQSLTNLTGALSTGGPTPTLSWSTLALVGIGTWFLMGALHRGTSRAYSSVTRPLKRRRKRKAELQDAEESYQKRRKSIERAYSK